MKRIFSLIGLVVAALITGGAEPPKLLMTGENNRYWNLSEYSSWRNNDRGDSRLCVEIPADAPIKNITYGASRSLDLTPYRGKQIVISADISAENVPSRKRESHRCAKIMIHHRGANGSRFISSSSGLWGTFPPQKQSLSFWVPTEAGKNTLMIGLQNNTGKVLVENLKIEEKDLFPAPVPVPEGYQCEYSDAVRYAPRLRGTACLNSISLASLRDYAAMGGNVLRFWLKFDGAQNDRKQLDDSLSKLEALLPECEKLQLKIIPILTNIPGGRFEKPRKLGMTDEKDNAATKNKSNFRLFFERDLLNDYVKNWRYIAEKLKDYPAVYGYSVMNEPSQFGEVPYDYLYCQYLAAKAIREVEPERPVYIASNNWDKADAFPYLKVLPLKNIIYEVHMYTPYEYTHQGVGASIENIKAGKYFSYPGKIGENHYDRNALRQSLQPVVDFQRKYGAKIYCGEFSVIRWAPGGAQYLEEVCSIFEELKWDWAYHCFREWINWDLEYPSRYPDNKRSIESTDRMNVIRKYWEKNHHPARPQ